jgi:SAM-dependent methyltransferase
MKSERLDAIIAAVRGCDILNLGCVGHKVPTTRAEKDHWLHYQLCVCLPNANVVGIDVDEPNVLRMRELGFNAEVGDAHNLRYEACFDTIVLGELIEHLQSPGECLAGCKRALKPGGRIIITTPNVFSIMLGLMYLKDFDTAFNPEHVAWFCPQTIRSLVERCGLRLTQLLFVDDLAPDVSPVLLYRMFVGSWLAVRWMLPKRYRNTMVAVCEPPALAETPPAVSASLSSPAHTPAPAI